MRCYNRLVSQTRSAASWRSKNTDFTNGGKIQMKNFITKESDSFPILKSMYLNLKKVFKCTYSKAIFIFLFSMFYGFIEALFFSIMEPVSTGHGIITQNR